MAFIGNTTIYALVTAAETDADDTFPVVVDGALKNITRAEMLNLFQAAGSYQASDATLTALAGQNWAANAVPIGTGADAVSQVAFGANTFPARAGTGSLEAKTITDFGLSLVDDANASTARTTLGLVIGTDVQAQDAELSAIAGLTSAANKVPRFTGSGTADLLDFSTNTSLGTSDTAVCSQNAVKTYVDNAVVGLWDIKGTTDCSANPNYPAASKGDAYLVSVAGRIGGASGTQVDAGDWYVATADNAGGTQASVGTSWATLEHNGLYASLSGTNTWTGANTFQLNVLVGSGSMSVGTNGVGVLVIGNSTAPTTTPADETQVYCADISADNAALHVVSEGTQALVTVGGVTIRQKSGVAGTDEATFVHDGTHLVVTNQDASGNVRFMVGSGTDGPYLEVTRPDLTSRYVRLLPTVPGVSWGQISSHAMALSSANGEVILNETPHVIFRVSANDTGVRRLAAAVVGVSNGSSGNGWMQNSAGRSRVASNVTNTTVTPANVTGLSATLIAGRKYTGELVLYCDEATAADGLRIDFDGGTATMTSFLAQGWLSDDTSTRPLARATALATDITDSTITGSTVVNIKFALVCNVAGTFIPRVAKEADAAGATLTVTANSYMWLEDTP